MQKYVAQYIDTSGNVISGGSVTVNDFLTGAVSSLFADDNVTPLSNPLTTDSNGMAQFSARDGRYNVTMAKAGQGTVVINKVLFDDNNSEWTNGDGSAHSYGQLVVATSATTMKAAAPGGLVSGICVSNSVAAGVVGQYLIKCGEIVRGLSGGTAGSLAYCGASGVVTSAATALAAIVGYWRSATELVFDPQPTPISFTAASFGAIGDGRDGTTTLQAALTASAGGVLVISPGNYTLSAVLNIPTSGVKIYAYGATFTRATGSKYYGFYLNNVTGFELHGAYLQGSISEDVHTYFDDSYQSFCGLIADAVIGCIIEGCTFDGHIRAGVQFRTNSCSQIRIVNNTFKNCGKYSLNTIVTGSVKPSLADGIASLGATDIQITGNRLFNCMHAHMVLLPWSGGAQRGARIIIAQNICDTTINSSDSVGSGTGDAAITIWYSDDVTVTGNIIRNVNAMAGAYGYGIRVENNNNSSITGNRVTLCPTAAGIQAYLSAVNVSITGNIVDQCARGCEINGVTNCEVTGNSFTANTQYGIISQGAFSQLTITGNTCQGNTLNGIIITDLADSVTVNLSILGNKVTGNGAIGIQLYPSGSKLTTFYVRTIISGNTLTGNGATGLVEVSCSLCPDVTVESNYCVKSGTCNAPFLFDATCTIARLWHNRATGYTFAYSNAAATFSLIGNDFTGCSQAICTNFAGFFAQENIDVSGSGYKTRNSGTGATIGAAATNVAITHGLINTPDVRQIQIFLNSTLGSAKTWYISSVTSTTFTVALDVAPGGGGITFSWKAELCLVT